MKMYLIQVRWEDREFKCKCVR